MNYTQMAHDLRVERAGMKWQMRAAKRLVAAQKLRIPLRYVYDEMRAEVKGVMDAIEDAIVALGGSVPTYETFEYDKAVTITKDIIDE
jgi:hypothetical protein